MASSPRSVGAASTATGLYYLSWVQRRSGADHRARWASAAGWAVMGASSYLGGSLVYRHRIGVDHSDKELEPRQFTAVLAESELGTAPRPAQAHGVAVVLARAGQQGYGGARQAHPHRRPRCVLKPFRPGSQRSG